LKTALLALLIFAALYLVGQAADYWPRLRRLLRHRGSRDWPICQGAIQSQRIETKTARHGQRYQALLIYSYNLGGNTYSSGFSSNWFSLKSEAERLLAKYRVNAAVMVRVNPKRPEDSILVLPE
jgi:hypothetical protein